MTMFILLGSVGVLLIYGISLYNNLVLANHLVGIYGHVKDLSETGRNFKLDPYEPKLSLTVVGGQLIGNGTGPISVDTPQSLTMYNVDMLAPPKPTIARFPPPCLAL